MAFDGTLKFDTSIDKSGFEAGLGKLGDIAKQGMAAVTGAITAATGALTALGTQALNAYADYEQLTGGVATLFGAQDMSLAEYAQSVGKTVDAVRGEYDNLMQAQTEVMRNAENAFQTAGLSQNEYMETVTSFSAALIASLGGDTVKAAQAADKAIVDMADNANKMGSSMESIQNAYQGFAKQNYTMLDNLKLGYGGTKTEMARLLADAQAISGIEYNLESYADIVEAIHVIQTQMGITGTTAKEAASTIQGSVAAAKAAWKNFLTGTGTPEQFARSLSVAVKNIRASLTSIIPNLMTGLTEMVDLIAPEIPPIIEETLPVIISGASTLVTGLAERLPELLTALLPSLAEGIVNVSAALISAMPQLIISLKDSVPIVVQTIMSKKDDLMQAGKDMISALFPAGKQGLESAASKATALIGEFASAVTNPQNLKRITDKALDIIDALLKGLTSQESLDHLFNSESGIPKVVDNLGEALVNAVDRLLDSAHDLIENLCRYFLDADNQETVKDAAGDILISLGESFVALVGTIHRHIVDLMSDIMVDMVGSFDADATTLEILAKLGKSLANNFTKFMPSTWAIDFGEGFAQSTLDMSDMQKYLESDYQGTYTEWQNRNQKTSLSQGYTISQNDYLYGSMSAAAAEAYRKARGYASGFVVDRPTWINQNTVIGENGMEALLPLETNTGWMNLLAEKLSERMHIAAEAAKALRVAQSERVTDDAVKLLHSFSEAPQWNIIQPSPTAAITNNYSYQTTNTTDSRPVVNVHVHVDASMDGDTIAEKLAERVDILQGETIEYDERGTAH